MPLTFLNFCPALYERGFFMRCAPDGFLLSNLQVLSAALALVVYDLVLNLLVLIEIAKPGALHRRNMHKHVLATAGWRDETITLCGIEPLHCSASH